MVSFTPEEYEQRYRQTREAMESEGLDALIAYSTAKVQANVRYLTRYFTRFTGMQSNPDGSYHMFGACACLFPLNGEPVVRTDQPWDVARAKEESLFPDTEFTSSFGEEFGPIIRDRGYRRVGVDNWYLFPAREYLALQKQVPDVEIVPTHLMSEVRRIKSPAELQLMRCAAQVGDEAVKAALDAVEIGKTEHEVDLVVEYKMREGGEMDLGGSSISGCGPNTASGTQAPTKTKTIEAGQWVMFDVCPRFEGYCGDISRMRLAGDPKDLDPRLRKIYEVSVLISQEVIKRIKPGVTGRELNELAQRIADDEGVGEYKSGLLGHGLGLDIHDIPDYWYDGSPWRAGEVITVEPALFIPGIGGTRIEDTVIVTDEGCEVLNQLDKSLTGM